MAFNLCPDDGYPRLWRFVGPGVLPAWVLCTLDKKFNTLTINKEAFDALPEMERHRVLRTSLVEIHWRDPDYLALAAE